MSTDSDGGCACKVGRAAETYGLEDLDSRLVARRRDGDSLRALAAYVNRRVLAAALREASDGEWELLGAIDEDDVIEAAYAALADDETPRERTARVRTRLEQAGVDVDSVTDDWVTHPTVRQHLRNCLDVDTSRDATIGHEDAVDTVEWARTRCNRIVARTVTRATNAGLVDVGDPAVSVSVTVNCRECGQSYRPARLLDRGSCECATEPGSDA